MFVWISCNFVVNLFWRGQLNLVFRVNSQTRYLIKYRHVDEHLVLKVTDDKVVRIHFCSLGEEREHLMIL